MSKHLNESYTLRLPAELKAKVAESAQSHNRSLNADIVARLEKSFTLSNLDQSEIIQASNSSLAAYRIAILRVLEKGNIAELKKFLSQTYEVKLIPVEELEELSQQKTR